MTPRQITDLFADKIIRVVDIHWLPGILGNPEGGKFKEALEEDELGYVLKSLGIKESSHRGDVEELCGILCRANRYGFIVTAETPVTKRIGKGAYQFSWGHYTRETFYTEALDGDFAAKLVLWRDDLRKKWDAKKNTAKSEEGSAE